jgi:hypothetical protein
MYHLLLSLLLQMAAIRLPIRQCVALEIADGMAVAGFAKLLLDK